MGGLGIGSTCSIQLDFHRGDGTAVPTASIKSPRSGRRDDRDDLPLFKSKETVAGTVCVCVWWWEEKCCWERWEDLEKEHLVGVAAWIGRSLWAHHACSKSPLFFSHSQVKVTPIPGKRVEHSGIRVQLVGEIELASERGYPHEFLSLVRDLAAPGDLPAQQSFPFSFENVEMQHDSYLGLKVRLRYLLRVTVSRGLGQSTSKDFPFWVRNYRPTPPLGDPIKVN